MAPLEKCKTRKQSAKEANEGPLLNTYVEGQSIVKELERTGWASTSLHAIYMRRCNEEKYLAPCFSIKYQLKHFFQQSASFVVGFDDLYFIPPLPS